MRSSKVRNASGSCVNRRIALRSPVNVYNTLVTMPRAMDSEESVLLDRGVGFGLSRRPKQAPSAFFPIAGGGLGFNWAVPNRGGLPSPFPPQRGKLRNVTAGPSSSMRRSKPRTSISNVHHRTNAGPFLIGALAPQTHIQALDLPDGFAPLRSRDFNEAKSPNDGRKKKDRWSSSSSNHK
jgi:hypothetical protein